MNTSKPEIPAAKLDTIFLTGPGGDLYELPAALAEAHKVTEARLSELGQVPIQLYPFAEEEEEVAGRHFIQRFGVGFRPHREILWGTALSECGSFMTGYHYHPRENEVAVFVDAGSSGL